MAKRAPIVRMSFVDEHRTSCGFLLSLLGAEATRRLLEAFSGHGLTPRQFHILALLTDEGDLEQTRLGGLMGLPPSAIVGLLNPLESEGLVSRERSLTDRRRHVVVLTEAGRNAARGASQAHHAAEDRLLRRLSGEQRKQLHQLVAAAARDLIEAHPATCDTP